MRADTRTKYDLSVFLLLLRAVAFFLAITVSVCWIGRLIGESLALVLTHTARPHQGWIIVQRFAHLVAYYVHQLLEHRLPKRERTESIIYVTSRQAGSIYASRSRLLRGTNKARLKTCQKSKTSPRNSYKCLHCLQSRTDIK